MARGKDSHWKPKTVFLLPDTFHNGDSYPGKERQSALENDGYGSFSVQDGFDRSWTIDQLSKEVSKHYPRHKDQLDKAGVEFAKITQGSKKIALHVLVKGDTVADLEKRHGKGILVILQKPCNASPKEPKAESRRSPHIQPENKSPKKLQTPLQIKSEPKPHIGALDQVQLELDTLAQSEGIKIAHLNCQSLCNKKDELQLLLLCRTDIDVMTLSETWLKPEDRNDSFSVPGYTILGRKDGVPKDSGRPRGGVLTYVKDSLAKSAKEVILDEDLEAVCVDIDLGEPAKHEKLDKKGRNGTDKELTRETESGACEKRALLRIVNVYVPPGTREQIKQFRKLQRSMDTLRAGDKCRQPTTSRGFVGRALSCTCKTNYVILGDLNCDRNNLGECKVMESVKGEKIQTLDELESSHHLTQLVRDFTRVDLRKERGRDTYYTTKAVIDVIYTDSPARISRSGVVHIAMSDHYMVYCGWGHGMKKRVPNATSLPTQDVAFRHFSSRVQTDIDQGVFDLIRKRDSAHAREDWEEYERLKDNITKAKNQNRKERKQSEKVKQKLKLEKVAV